MKQLNYSVVVLFIFLFSCQSAETVEQSSHPEYSGVYPHLAYYNKEGECGTGAIVPWADRLWVITYGPHMPYGSSDKLYEITPDLDQIVRKESIGGTPANRMIHTESNQLFIGPYAIDTGRNVRTIPNKAMRGRLTASARHLTDPAHKMYTATMEEGFYEVDVNTLEPTMLYKDKNGKFDKTDYPTGTEFNYANLPGDHGKGMYSGQGVVVFCNNGERTKLANKQFDVESGVLAEWDGKDWKVILRNQFVELTGPGGIYGNKNPETDPIWATGWDNKSINVGVRNPKTGWHFYRLPKASHSYDGAHGWNTEWPRIRNIGTEEKPDYLMTMHGMFWKFPSTFTTGNSAGIRPRSSYLKVIGDFARWKDQLVFGCDDSAKDEFLNKRPVKGDIGGAGQSNSNLWFMSLDKPDHIGPTTASGAVWLHEDVEANVPSDPFLFAGWLKRSAWISNHGIETIDIMFQIDAKGDNNWTDLRTEELKAGESKYIEFTDDELGQWLRMSSSKNANLTAQFEYTGEDNRSTTPDVKFAGLTVLGEESNFGALLYALGDNRRALGLATTIDGKQAAYYELDGAMNLSPKEDPEMLHFIHEKFAIPEDPHVVDDASVLIVDSKNRRWRLPLGNDINTELIANSKIRLCREVATERDLLNCHGTFYELPAENADGYAKIRPISSHNYRIHDYASFRGLLVLSGISPKAAKNNDHIILSEDRKAAVWLGAIDDLWEMGKPVGKGGPWKNTDVKAEVVSDPYLIGFYDHKELTLSHNSPEDVTFTIQIEALGHGPWMNYKEVTVKAGEKFNYTFSDKFQARWIRFKSNKDCVATAWLVYN